MKLKCICVCTHLHENAKKKTQKKPNAKKNRKRKRTQKKKNENAYFQEGRGIFSRTKTQKKKTKTKTQILGERCQLSSGEYCITCIYLRVFVRILKFSCLSYANVLIRGFECYHSCMHTVFVLGELKCISSFTVQIVLYQWPIKEGWVKRS